jgi:acetyl-CoA carboxylase biotin carboxyl carrier protein
MEIGEIRKLVELMEEKGLMELEVEDRKGKIRLVRENHHAASVPVPAFVPATVAAPLPSVQTVVPSETGGGRERDGSSLSSEQGQEKSGQTVNSPMVGTFYRASSPEAEPYVDVGNVVNQGDVLCIIEAMKMMNEIEAEFGGRIIEVLVENGQPVEYEQPLFLIGPLQE